MSDGEMRQLFDTVLNGPPPETVDVDASIRTGRRRRRRRVVLASVAVIFAVAGVVTAVVVPGSHRAPVSVTADTGVVVTDADQLTGSWQTIQLDGTDVSAVRDSRGAPLGLTFQQGRWGANDVINYHRGEFTLSARGRLSFGSEMVTGVGSIGGRELYTRNASAVVQATEARLLPATSSTPPKLLLLTDGKVTAVYLATVSPGPS